MDHIDDMAIKAEIDDISYRINSIVQKLEEMDPNQETDKDQKED